jgi:YHS domain-containing protein/biotin operon repressor
MDVSTIGEMLDIPQANISQHLQILRAAGVVVFRRNGKGMYYKLAHANFIKASDLVREILIEKHKNDELTDDLSHKMKELVPLTSDPVCGMRLSPKTAAFAKKLKGNEYYFCASGCFEKFNKKPDLYI